MREGKKDVCIVLFLYACFGSILFLVLYATERLRFGVLFETVFAQG